MAQRGVVQRVMDSGVKGASPLDLVAVGFSRREDDANQSEAMARNLLQRFGSLPALVAVGNSQITELTGLEGFEVLKVQALLELGRRSEALTKDPVSRIDSPSDAFDLLRYLRGEKKEHFVAVLLDAKNHVMRVAEIHVGTLTASIVGPREVFREAIRDGACSIIVAHNHPSGDPTPSPEDRDITEKLTDIGDMLDIPVLDHIIIGEAEGYSLRSGKRIGNMGRNHLRVARESTGYARGQGSRPGALP